MDGGEQLANVIIASILVRSNCWVHPVQLFTELNGRIMAEIVGIGGDEKEGKKFRKEKFDNNIIIIIMIYDHKI